jgi:serine/threonine protein kinase
LGHGTFGTVFLARHRKADPERPWSAVAVKRAIPSSTDTNNGRDQLWSIQHLERQVCEIKALRHLREGSAAASRVVHMYEYYLATPQEYYIVTELLGMELEEYKTSDLAVDFNENTVRDMSRAILRAVQYMHSKGTNVKRGRMVVVVAGRFSFRSTSRLFRQLHVCFTYN